MYVFTFYSFKGGVGRTMALVNVAAELVRRGRKVLVVDFDLEAPGLETYQRLSPPKPHPGIVEYVSEFRRNYEVPNLLDYIYETKPIGKKGGRLWVMPAGRRDRAYRSALTNLDWQRLYKEESGFLLFEDTKAGWEKELKPDYVLIDSRTGDTDVLGICTRQLPDSVVLMFVPNEQNLSGLENVCRDIRREETEGLKKKIKLHFVAANVPDMDDERGILRRQMQAFKKRLEFENLSGKIRRYENLNLLDQSVFTVERPHSKLAKSYRRMLRTLIKDNVADRDGAMSLLEDYSEWMATRASGTKVLMESRQPDGTLAITNADGEDVSAEGKHSLQKIARHFHYDTEILKAVADCYSKEQEYKKAISTFDSVLKLEPKSPETLLARARCKINQGELNDAGNDLVACLGLIDTAAGLSTPIFNSNWHLASTCLQRLCIIAPSRLTEVVDMFNCSKMDCIGLVNLVNLLCLVEDGIPHAARLLRTYLAGLQGTKPEYYLDVSLSLLTARCWREFINLHEPECVSDTNAHELFQLAIAHWGESGEMPEALCRQALDSADGDISADVASILFWRVGNPTEALNCIEIAENQACRKHEDDNCFSWWRLCDVSLDLYLSDCRLIRRMIQGEPLRPAFLGPAFAPSQK